MFLYVEGETDEACLRGWARALHKTQEFAGLAGLLDKVAFHYLKGGNADEMISLADRHFKACRFLSDDPCRLLVLDRNDGKWQARVGKDEQLLVWTKRHIESYLLVPEAWVRAVKAAADSQFELRGPTAMQAVRSFFLE